MHSGSEQLEKESWLLSDGSGALPRAMKLPCSTNRESVTSFPVGMLTVMAMVVVTAGEVDYVAKHHWMNGPASLSRCAKTENNKTMGFRGMNSLWDDYTHQEEHEGEPTELACDNARHGTVCHELGVRVPKACGGNWHGSHVRGVQVSTAEMLEELKVQVLGRRNSVNASEERVPGTCRELACEKCGNAGATCIQHDCNEGENAGATRIQHGSFSGVICTSDCGAFAMEMNVEKAVGVECNQCCELASLNNSYSLDNVTFEPYIELCRVYSLQSDDDPFI